VEYLDDIFVNNKGMNPKSEYVCKKCGKTFGDSLGDMELH